ncbi:hypothetical protein [Mesorhizobium wenxiniae]|uniref:Uncharacterized protein n=1 Tax=Mesorhizobium wenxiniae TaxID=2014805 RepID=A0A271KLK2_9HYPH|nr:hypothetical protein [Mesorhizobium wenxiniae]PAP96642.1 hypothetical protein CIT31_02620 [Mesorhizobium wenxiniae]
MVIGLPLSSFHAYLARMSYDHFRPPEHLSPTGKLLFRALCLVTFIVAMGAVIYYLGPLIDRYVGVPFADWITNLIFGPKA